MSLQYRNAQPRISLTEDGIRTFSIPLQSLKAPEVISGIPSARLKTLLESSSHCKVLAKNNGLLNTVEKNICAHWLTLSIYTFSNLKQYANTSTSTMFKPVEICMPHYMHAKKGYWHLPSFSSTLIVIGIMNYFIYDIRKKAEINVVSFHKYLLYKIKRIVKKRLFKFRHLAKHRYNSLFGTNNPEFQKASAFLVSFRALLCLFR